MGQVLHGSATTTEAIRRAIQNSQESLRALSRRYNINQKTVAKWKKRTSVPDLPTGPNEPRSTVLSLDEEAMIVAFRQHTRLPPRYSPAVSTNVSLIRRSCGTGVRSRSPMTASLSPISSLSVSVREATALPTHARKTSTSWWRSATRRRRRTAS